MGRSAYIPLLLGLALLCRVPAASQPGPATAAAGAWALYRDSDFFALQAKLPPATDGAAPDMLFLQAAVLAAFSHPEPSARLLERLLSRRGLSPSLDVRVRELLMLDRRAVFHYRDALDAVAPLLRGSGSTGLAGIRNRARLLRAIADAGPQIVTEGRHAALELDARGRIEAFVAHRPIRVYPDTGANISVLPRHLAQALGLRIRPANYAVGSSVGGRVESDVAVADIALADGTRVRNAIFLVLPDKAVPVALLGHPVLSALGSMDYSNGTMAFGSPVRLANKTPLALSGNDLLLKVRYAGQGILCRLDSGAARSVFYAPFYRRFRGTLRTSGRKGLRVGGATGTRRLGAREFDSLTIEIAGRAFRLAPAFVITDTVHGVPNAALACNIGRDVLRAAGRYRIDFTDMTLGFRS